MRRIVLGLLALLALSCSNEVTRTQLTFQIDAGPSVRQGLQTLEVTVTSKNTPQKATFSESQLVWPVEIVVIPEDGQNSTTKVELSVIARGATGVLAQKTASGSFVPEQLTVVRVALGDDVPDRDGGSEEEVRDARVDDRDSGMSEVDSGQPADNCETNDKLECDDGNPCNGEERCSPQSNAADARGCVPSDSPVMCSQDMTCDSTTGECSTCLAKPDGDGDGVDSLACGGLDCDDNNKNVAPGKPEKCNNRDDDCDGTRDGTKANADCTASAPTGGTASCVSGACVGACTKAGQQIVNGACVDPPAQCPVPNPCLPGRCEAGSPTYVCICPTTHRAGVGNTRCAPIGVPRRTLGFETSCEDMPIPSPAMSEAIPIAPTQFATCGVASITSGALMTGVQLVRPTAPTTIGGITAATALEVTPGAARSELAIGFSQPVTELSFDILDIDDVSGLKVTLRAGESPAFDGTIPPPAAGSKQTRFSYLQPAMPVDLVVITYTPVATVPPAPADRLFIDQLSYRVGGCGDGVMEGTEACDDGDAVQCDGCDNACALSSASSPGCAP